MTNAGIGVLVVEDEEVAGRAHAEYVRRMPGFRLIGQARSAVHALAAIADDLPGVKGADIQLVLLDMNLPDGHGLEVLRAVRMRRLDVDVIPVTAASDLTVVQQAMALGAVQYLVKPFTFAAFKAKLQAYAEYRSAIRTRGEATQAEIDQAFEVLRANTLPAQSKGIAPATAETILAHLEQADAASAAELGEVLGVSRVTARRYLEALADQGTVERVPRYGATGRPVLEYRLA